MNKFKKKILLGLGAVTAVVAPVAAVIACSTTETYVQQTTGYTDSITKVQNGSLNFVGGFNDLRAFLGTAEKAQQVEVVGVESQRISNDGLQVIKDMNAGDQHALQVLFQIMVQDPSIKAKFGGKEQQVFQMYSHSGYTVPSNGETIGYMEDGKPVAKKAYADGGVTPTSSPTGSAFAMANQVMPGSIDFSTAYDDFKAKTGGNKINIAMIPSKDPAALSTVVKRLNEFAVAKGLPLNFVATTDYNVAATALGTTYQGAYLPVSTWGKLASNKSNFILQASRKSAVATLDLQGDKLVQYAGEFTDTSLVTERANRLGTLYLIDLPKGKTVDQAWVDAEEDAIKKLWRAEFFKAFGDDQDSLHAFVLAALKTRNTVDETDSVYKAGKYEALIYAKKGSDFAKKVADARKAQGKDFQIKLSDFGKFTYGRTSPTSSASSVYPELWFRDHIYVEKEGDFNFGKL